MRFITFAATTLLGCLLSSGICAATPISTRGSSISQEITARSPTPNHSLDCQIRWISLPGAENPEKLAPDGVRQPSGGDPGRESL
ncbi:hypothetical protein BDP27DRAFT_1436047 [Rhodocollybia butyracea]|uniref:Uncharacterized protein n=1 Tax=Rhodocollybia butyracea TaxID=206335 RepID=A0A9P5P5L5_9AGAR|nr:hypothetical protein BDP27DRAFT_1436047 [Rhodocollybia butyracea]